MSIITKVLVSAAIGLGLFIGGAAPASADSNSFGTNPNPFSTLSGHRPETAPPGSPALSDEINRGFREGFTASVPGLPAPTQHGQPRQ
jgi:hypothetical protein